MSFFDKSVYTSFDLLPEKCLKLIDDCGKKSLFLSLPWFKNYEDTVVRKCGCSLIFTSKDNCALLPMSYEFSSSLFKPRQLMSMSNFYTTHYSVLVDTSAEDPFESVQQLVNEMVKNKANWDVVNIKPLLLESESILWLKKAFKKQGWFVQDYFSHGNWYIQTNGNNFKEYCLTRGSQIRKTIANRVRKFDRIEGSRFEIVQGRAGLDTALKAFKDVYKLRWGKDEPYSQFIDGLAGFAADHGWLRLGVAWVEDKPIAAQLWIVRNEIAYIYKVAFAPSFNHLSIGSVATYKMMENVLNNDQVMEVDFLTGDDGYKKLWMKDRREYRGLLAINPKTPRGLMEVIKVLGVRYLKKGIEYIKWHTKNISSKN